MANISQFQVAPNQDRIQASEEGPSAYARIGREQQYTSEQAGNYLAKGVHDVGNAAKEVGQVYDRHMMTKDILNASQQQADLAVKSSQELSDIQAHAEDPVEATKKYYTEKYAPANEAITNSMNTEGGKRFAAEHGASHAEAFMTRHLAEAQHLEGARTIATYHDTLNTLAVAAQGNPAMAGTYADQAEHTFQAIKGNLAPAQQVEFEKERPGIRGQIVRMGAHGAVTKSDKPEEEADNYIHDHAKDLSERDQEEIRQFAKSEVRERDWKARKTSEEAVGKVTSSLIDADGQLKPITRDIISQINQNPDILPSAKGPLITRLNYEWKVQTDIEEGRQAKKEDQTTIMQFRNRIGDPDHPLTDEQITKAEVGGLISPKTAQGMRNAMQDYGGDDPKSRDLKDRMKDADGTLLALTKNNTGFGQTPATAEDREKYNQAKQSLQEYVRGVKKEHPEATDADIFKKEGKYYWFTNGNFERFRSSTVASSLALPPVAGSATGEDGKKLTSKEAAAAAFGN